MSKILKEFKLLIWPALILIMICAITIPVGTFLYEKIPSKAVEVYDGTFKSLETSKQKHIEILDTLHNTALVSLDKIYEKTGPIGDTFGGTVGPFIALFASFLTFLAFYIQYRANVQQRIDIELERFESKYFELIALHKANVDEINIANKIKGRKSFVKMFNELSFCYKICESYNDILSDKEKLNIIELTKFSYHIFFFGIGKNSEKQLSFKDKELVLFNHVKTFLNKIQEVYTKKEKFDVITEGIDTRELHRRNLYNEYNISFKPFDGHISILAHYYRHLFQTVKFVIEHKGLNEKEKLNYLKIIRAQLSNHEQLMLYYNGVSMANEIWFDKEYFTRYKMIHNIPLPLADFGIEPENHPKIIAWYKKGHEDLFEWE